MKLFLITLFFSFFWNFTYAQQFSGKLNNLTSNELEVLSYHDLGYYKRDTVYADAGGNFTMQLNLQEAGYIYLRGSNFRNEEIYLYPGADLYLNADAATGETFWDTQQYTGTAAIYNNFRADFERHPQKKRLGWSRATYDLAQAAFVNSIDKFFLFRDSLKHIYFEKVPASNALKDFMVTDSVQAAYFKSAVWRSYYGIHEDDKFYQAYLEPMNMQSEDVRFLASSNYRTYFSGMIRQKYDEWKAATGKALAWYAYFDKAPELIKNNLNMPLQYVVSSALLEGVVESYKEVADTLLPILDANLARVYPLVKSSQLILQTQGEIAGIRQFRDRIQNGTPALEIDMVNSSGKPFSLADFKGKLIYIDVWASWCGPCIAEFPNARKLQEAYKDDDRLVFIALSVDDSRNDWLEKGMKHNPAGLQFLSPGGFKSKFIKDYRISGIPHYILIDEHGKFVSYSAPRPGSAGIKDTLNKALSAMKK